MSVWFAKKCRRAGARESTSIRGNKQAGGHHGILQLSYYLRELSFFGNKPKLGQKRKNLSRSKTLLVWKPSAPKRTPAGTLLPKPPVEKRPASYRWHWWAELWRRDSWLRLRPVPCLFQSGKPTLDLPLAGGCRGIPQELSGHTPRSIRSAPGFVFWQGL